MRGDSTGVGRVAALLVGLLGLGLGDPVFGQTLTVDARTIYHAYEIPLWPDGPNLGNRNLNRFYQTLDLGGWSLLDGDLDVVVSLRYDTDFGTGFHPDTPAGAGIPAVDGRDDLDLRFAYVDWRNIVKGRLHARFGRQVVVDDLAWYSLDGLRVTVTPWRDGRDGVDVDLYVGTPVRFDVVFSSEPFLNDGTQVDDRGPFGGLVFGGSGRLRILSNLTASLSYRQEVAFREDDLAAFRGDELGAQASAGSAGLMESRLGASLGYELPSIGAHVYGSMVWDAFVGALEQARAGVGYDPLDGVHAQVEYLRSRPRFAGDSIFNWFNIFGYDRGRAEVSVEIIEGLTVKGGYLFQAFGGGATFRADAEFRGSDLSHGPSAGVTYRTERFGVGAYGEAATNTGGEYAYGGNYRMGWLFGDVSFFERRLTADARVSVTSVQTDWFEDIDDGEVAPVDTSVMLALGARGRITDFLSTRVLFVKNFGAVLEGSYRLYSELAVRY